MKIDRIDVYEVTYRLVDARYAWSGGHAVTALTSAVVRVATDTGLVGFGEVCPLGPAYMAAHARGVAAALAELGPVLLGADPTKPRAVTALMDQALGGHAYAKSPVDIACWDILGQATGRPVADLLGGRLVEDFPLYRAISQETPESMAETVRRYRDEGYRKFQLKVGGVPEDDVARVRAVARVLAPGDLLVADANTGWRPHEALRVAREVADIDCYLEQPCATLAECLVVRERTRAPMVLDELLTDFAAFHDAAARRAMDAVNLKLSRLGGLTKAREIRDACERLGIAMTIEDSWGGDLATAAIAHLAGSTRPEWLLSSTDFNSYVDVRLADEAPRRAAGRLRVPSGPGLGIRVDENRLGRPVLTLR